MENNNISDTTRDVKTYKEFATILLDKLHYDLRYTVNKEITDIIDHVVDVSLNKCMQACTDKYLAITGMHNLTPPAWPPVQDQGDKEYRWYHIQSADEYSILDEAYGSKLKEPYAYPETICVEVDINNGTAVSSLLMSDYISMSKVFYEQCGYTAEIRGVTDGSNISK